MTTLTRARPALRAGSGTVLRVAVVTDGVYPYFNGGKELRAYQLFSRMHGDKVSVELFTMRWWGRGDRAERSGLRMRGLCRARPMYTGSRRSIVQAVAFAASCLRLWTVDADVVDADHMPYLPLLPVLLICRARRIPVVVTWHEWWGKAYWSEYLGPLGAPAAWLERSLARLAPRLVVHTPATAQQLAAAGVEAQRISVVANGVDVELIDQSPPSPISYDVLFVGRLLSHKNAHLLVEAVALLRERDLVLSCGIVGEGPEAGRLAALVDELDLRGQVSLLGKVDTHLEVFGLMKSARAFVLPTTREGYGMAVAEALACGTPVVTTDHPANHARELVREGTNGWLCQPDARSLADALERAMRRPLDRSGVAAGGRALGWDQAVECLTSVYRQSVEESR